MHRRLHWGCGPITPFGWVNSDIMPGPGVDVAVDIRRGLPFNSNEFDYIVSIHVLPELSYPELDPALAELRRVLKPGGVLRLGLPDMDRAIEAYRRKDVDYFLIPDETVRSLAGKMIVQLTWYGRSKTMYTREFAQELLERNGYRDVRQCKYQETSGPFGGITELDDRPLESLFVEGTK
jgi:predicted SAM-dependent methyltransferase